MNVGQVFECLLGFSGKTLKEKYIIKTFLTNNTSKEIVYHKLLESMTKSKKTWIFNTNCIGKTKIFNGKTGKSYKQPVTIGYSYILKLMHMASEKIISRTIGNYSIITKQPLKGKSKKGGQRFGEMEIWALEGFGSAFNLQEIITLKSDDMNNKYNLLKLFLKNKKFPYPNIPESFKLLILELKSICINITIYESGKNKFN